MRSVNLTRLADSIRDSGVRAVFGILGSGRSLELVSALRERDIAFYATHFEGSAAMMAGATGLLSGEVGAVISIKGPGLANMIPGLALCKFENLPLVAMSEAFEIDRPLTRTHKYLDHQSLVAALVKFSDVCDAMDDGFGIAQSLARSEIPGPVHLDLVASPKRKAWVAEDSSVSNYEERSSRAEIRNICASAKKPALIIGSLCARLNMKAQIEQLSFPIFTTVAAKGSIDEELPYSAGIFTGAGVKDAPERLLLGQADVVLSIGLRMNEILDHSENIKNVVNFDLAVGLSEPKGNIRTICVTEEDIVYLLDNLKSFEWGRSEIYRCRERISGLSGEKGFLPAHVYQILQATLPEKTRYVVDTGNFCTVAEHLFVSRRPYEKLFSANGRYMGSALPLGIGAALTDTSVPTVVICGDGGIGMYISEIKIAVENHLPLLVILMSDRGYASILGNARKKGLNQEVLQIKNPSWSEPFTGFMLETSVVESASDLDLALAKFESGSGPQFIQCWFDQQAYLQMTSFLRT